MRRGLRRRDRGGTARPPRATPPWPSRRRASSRRPSRWRRGGERRLHELDQVVHEGLRVELRGQHGGEGARVHIARGPLAEDGLQLGHGARARGASARLPVAARREVEPCGPRSRSRGTRARPRGPAPRRARSAPRPTGRRRGRARCGARPPPRTRRGARRAARGAPYRRRGRRRARARSRSSRRCSA